MTMMTMVCAFHNKAFSTCPSHINFIIQFFFLDRSMSEVETSKHSSQFQSIEKTEETPMFPKKLPPPQLKEHPPSVDSSDGEEEEAAAARSKQRKERSESGQLSHHSRFGSKGALHSPVGSMHSFDLQVCTHYVFPPFSTNTVCFSLYRKYLSTVSCLSQFPLETDNYC